MTGAAWYAVMTKANAEGKADAELRRLGYHTFYPFERVRQKRKIPNRPNHRIVEVERPIYSRYLFVYVQPHQGFKPVSDADAVSAVVSVRGAPLRIPDRAINALMECCGEDGLYRHRDAVSRERLRVGVPVQFLEDGPLYGLVAQVAQDLGESVRVVMQMFGADREIITKPENLKELKKAS